jgi:inhibitor of the pro-sigma K processing machinery
MQFIAKKFLNDTNIKFRYNCPIKIIHNGREVIFVGNYTFLVYIGCIIMIFIVGKIFIFPLKKIVKLIANSIIGGMLIYIINIVGSSFNFHIGLNWWTILCSGILGVPGVILVVLLKVFV